MTSPAALYDELLEQMLTGDPLERARAWAEAMRDGYGGLTVVDEACDDERGPAAFTLAQLARHLSRTDNEAKIRMRGYRLHTTGNTRFGSLEETDHGPAHWHAR